MSTPAQLRTGARGKRAYVYLVSMVAAISGLLFGFDTAVINGALPFLRDEFRLSDAELEIAASGLLWGCVAGAAVAGLLSDARGRRKTLLYTAVLFCVAAIGSALPRDLAGLVAARFAGGVAIGIASVLAPMYIAEVSPAAIRGQLVSLNQLAIVTGIFGAYFVNWRLALWGPGSWRWMLAVAAVPSAAFFAALLGIPESPRWLVQKGRDDEARDVLGRLNDDPDAEVEAIRRSLEEESASTYRDLLRPGLRRALFVAVSLAILQQVTGINTIIYYGSIVLRDHAGQGAVAAIGANVLIGAVNVICTIVAMFVIDRTGRRPLLMAGAAGMGVSLVALGFVFRAQPLPVQWVLAMILAYVGSFSVSLGPGVWVCISEMFPNSIRGRAVSVATLALWLACVLVTMTFLTIANALGAAGAFWLYASLCAVTILFVWRLTPETKGRPLEEIQELWRPQ